jgi:hypothetical protein
LIFKKDYYKGSLVLLLAVLSYWYAVTFRGVDFVDYTLAYEQFLEHVESEGTYNSKVQFLFAQVINVDFASSTSVAIEISKSFTLDIVEYFIYFLSLTPLPSSMLPEKVYFFGSLTRAAGLSIGVGINTDIMSEPYLMFGWIGVILMWFIFGLFFSLIESTASRCMAEKRFLAVLILCLPLVGFFMLGSVASIRSSSRLLWWVFILLMLSNVFVYFRYRR